MASKHFPFIAATAFAAILFNFILKRRSSEINEGEADNDAAANAGTARGASSTHTSTEGQGMATSSGCDFEVFLNFRGPDTGATFTDYLYSSMIDANIRAFKDNKDVRIREEINPELLQAIYVSKISIPIFSKGYASSVWCLKELVHMVNCQKTMGQKIMPIFYDVAPSEVQHQTGGFGEAFRSHENKKRYEEETIREWKAALKVVGEQEGWDLQSMPIRQEGQFAKTVTQDVFNELKKVYLVVSNCLVNVDHQVDEIMKMIGAGTSETRIVGIHGMGGIGKTTIAKIIYNKLSNNFKDCCFLLNIRESSQCKGIEYLQHQLISHILKKICTDIRNIDDGIQIIKYRFSNKVVLLLLDDVDDKYQIDALVGKLDWFGKGSKLIITTRNKYVLDVAKVDSSYEVSIMNPDQSLQLFSKHAFRRNAPLDEYIDQSKKAISIAGGLPLALEVIGRLLSRVEKKRWDAILDFQERFPHKEVFSKLKISYDTLDIRQKHIFLDIACLFIGYDKDILVHFWDQSKNFSEDTMECLQNMSLIKITKDNKVWMHDQLRDLGREIVRCESHMKIECQSKVWNPKEALDLLRKHERKTKVEAIRLKFDHEKQHRFTCEGFMGLPNLRFLEVDGLKENFHAEEMLLWHELPSNILSTKVFQENRNLLPQLRWLSWHNIPPTLNITNFSMEDMVILDLSQSEITNDWNGWSHMKVMKSLKVLNLTGCYCLEKTPNFSALANIEHLILWGCTKLVEIDKSICQLKRLVSLDVRCCRCLQRLPKKLDGLTALNKLLVDCTAIDEIPNCGGMRELRILTASRCQITTLPPSIGDLASLEYLSLGDCRSLERLPDSIENLISLIELDISGTRIKKLPDTIGNLKKLKIVNMTGSSISKIPDALWKIEMLEEIAAIGELPFYVKIGNCIHRNQSLRILRLRHAKIYVVPRLPENLIILEMHRLHMDIFPDLSNLINLKNLRLWFEPHDSDGKFDGPMEDQMPWWIGKLSKLESLDLCSNYVTTLPTDIFLLLRLESLELRCSNLHCLPRLPSGLLSLCLHNCVSLCLMDLSNLSKLSSLAVSSSAISKIQGLDCLKNLQNLLLSGLGQVEILPDLSNLSKLRLLALDRCGDLVEIQGKLPHSLEVLEIFSCESLEKLPDLSMLKRLQKVSINDCKKLKVETISCLGLQMSDESKGEDDESKSKFESKEEDGE